MFDITNGVPQRPGQITKTMNWGPLAKIGYYSTCVGALMTLSRSFRTDTGPEGISIYRC